MRLDRPGCCLTAGTSVMAGGRMSQTSQKVCGDMASIERYGPLMEQGRYGSDLWLLGLDMPRRAAEVRAVLHQGTLDSLRQAVHPVAV